jgi:hypothetical protein
MRTLRTRLGVWLWKVSNLPNVLRGAPAILVGALTGFTAPIGRLYATVLRADGRRTMLGLISTRVVTTAGVGYIVDAFQGSVEPENMKYHGMGTGNTAENASDTQLVTEVETRATGTTTEGASANIYRTVGTCAATTNRAIVEHGVFSASSNGVLLDRSVFSTINLANGDSIQFTYELTFPSGS